MAQYLLLYHGKNQKDSWDGFAREISNSLVRGRPLIKAKSVTQDEVVAEDGEDVTGFTLVEAKDVHEAVELSRGAPELNQGGRADVYKVVDNTA
jgi:hypothetical protein